MKSKQKLIDFIARQTNITLENNPHSILNDEKKTLYTTINRKNRNTVLTVLIKKGIKYENHIHNKYFIYL